MTSRKATAAKPRKTTKKAPPAASPQEPETPESHALIPAPVQELAKPGGGKISYPGASSLAFKPAEQKAFRRDFNDDELEITPDGIVYAPAQLYRDRLDEVLGQGRWALLRQTTWEIVNGVVMATFHLTVDQRYLFEATGAQKYHPNNKRMDYGDAIEGAESSALKRVCKKLGIGNKLFIPKFRREWRKKHATRYWCVNKQDGERKPMWFRNDDEENPTWPWERNGEAPVMQQPKARKGAEGKQPQARQKPAKTPPAPPAPKDPPKKSTPPPAPPAEEAAGEHPLECQITGNAPTLKSGDVDLYRFRFTDEAGGEWWGGTKNLEVADVLTSCFSNGTAVQVTFKEHEGSGLREILTADPVM